MGIIKFISILCGNVWSCGCHI